MKAIVQDRYGGPEVLRLAERGEPTPGAGEVVVEVVATGVDAGTVHLLEGRPAPVRLAMPLKGERVLGMEVAGRVRAVGDDVTDLSAGDAVFGSARLGHGGLAEYAVVRRDRLARRPPGVTFGEAAALVVSGSAALKATQAARIAEGDRVLVLGAAGGVGHLAVQVAKAAGAMVVGACSRTKTDLVASVGADEVIDYTAEDPLRRGPFDAIIDTGGHRPLRALRRALTPRGALVLVGAEPEGAPMAGLGRAIVAAMLDPFARQRLVMLASTESVAALDTLAAHAAAGKLRPVIDAEYPLEAAAEAIARIGHGKGRGKVVVRVRPE
ncbi:NAD(P)-dependent alcohol dehydrogenase [Microbacterium sp. Marseille-Q6965]|uniref:NAD(P)-dependent alcohol dehydrogenase n=1 Tax=Microbacterium sp. Marseille-Q6965 TaxID=2965072 RepID=UPI0021B7271B|nr:NAD(P)-dependent alcohol dehydrogenase [Microbacterium sp. Marseille-Q6965]